jgi:phage gp45-like
MDNLFPDGYDDRFDLASPFGFISGIPKGVTGFFQSLFGSGYANIIVALQHAKRPSPSGPGETILYSTDSSGNTVKVKITLGADGTLTINAPTKVVVNAPDVTVNASTVELGSGALEKVLNGETFQTFFNEHQHLGNMGIPTGMPIVPSDAAHLSAVVKAAK